MRQLIDRGRRAIARFQQSKEIIAVGHHRSCARLGCLDRPPPHPPMTLFESPPASATSANASSCTIGNHSLPTRRIGWRRSGSFWISCSATVGADMATAEGVERIALIEVTPRCHRSQWSRLSGRKWPAQVAGTVMESLGHGQSLFCSGRAMTPAGTKLWPRRGSGASDVRLVNRRLSGAPIGPPFAQLEGS